MVDQIKLAEAARGLAEEPVALGIPAGVVLLVLRHLGQQAKAQREHEREQAEVIAKALEELSVDVRASRAASELIVEALKQSRE